MYGTHPFYWYFILGVPAITGLLFPVLIYDLLFVPYNHATRNLWTVIGSYVIFHSFSDHKEFRFILPVLPMMCLIAGSRIQNLVTGITPSRKKQIMVACAAPNLLAVLYLGLIHQRAPIQVNRAILKAVATTEDTGPIHVHYLMGCHSTPLLSHLHNPPRSFVPWYLDCSPECRKNSDIECESDSFSNDPNAFIQNTYFNCVDQHENEQQTCSNTRNFRGIPDYLVCDASNLPKIKSSLKSIGMHEIARFVNGVNEVRLREDNTLWDISCGSLLSFGYEEMVLFQRSRPL